MGAARPAYRSALWGVLGVLGACTLDFDRFSFDEPAAMNDSPIGEQDDAGDEGGDADSDADSSGGGADDGGDSSAGGEAESGGADTSACSAQEPCAGAQVCMASSCVDSCQAPQACPSAEGLCEACVPVCGDGMIEGDETCEPGLGEGCPVDVDCASDNPCVAARLAGDPATCTSRCEHTVIEEIGVADGCCPDGASALNDADCSSGCGNKVVEPGENETCEPGTAQDCPASCDDGDPCTVDLRTGSEAACNVRCEHMPVKLGDADACCPEGANQTTDVDCEPVCDNAVIEDGELCDGNCPSDCEQDADPCTTRVLMGSACSRYCETVSTLEAPGCCPPGATAQSDPDCEPSCGNGVVEAGEVCDPPGTCPSSCDDDNACTADFMVGDPAACTARCEWDPVELGEDDACCPSGANASTDPDCEPSCGNGVVEPGESCEPSVGAGCPQACPADDLVDCFGYNPVGMGCFFTCERNLLLNCEPL